ncbi:hypothetical protein [Daejeonella sp.]|jgi:hypothetical protein|uniref:hypothetical protein n=1 Tax=Daejeonella sp. TaxID=2805397 RepID=UPI003784A8E9
MKITDIQLEEKRKIQLEEKKKILKGLEIAYEKLLAFKKMTNSELVVLRNNEIVRIKP